MPAPTSRGVASFGRSVASGRVFAQFQFNRGDIEGLADDLSYAALPGTIESAGRIREAGQKVLEYLKANYPKASAKTLRARAMDGNPQSRLVEGWRVRFYTSEYSLRGAAGGLLGFAIHHRQEDNARARAIIASLESGSRPHRIFPVEQKFLRFPGLRQGRMLFAKQLDIPARRGFGFIRKTENYAESLLAAHGSLIEREMVEIIEKGRRFKTVPKLNAESVATSPTSAVSAAIQALGTQKHTKTLSDARSPLKAVQTLKKRLVSRRFRKSFR